MTLQYAQADELPAWEATVTVNGAALDFSTGWTFAVRIADPATDTLALTKTTGITGATGGVVTVAWATTDLDIDPQIYRAQLTGTRIIDSAQFTVDERVRIRPRNDAL